MLLLLLLVVMMSRAAAVMQGMRVGRAPMRGLAGLCAGAAEAADGV